MKTLVAAVLGALVALPAFAQVINAFDLLDDSGRTQTFAVTMVGQGLCGEFDPYVIGDACVIEVKNEAGEVIEILVDQDQALPAVGTYALATIAKIEAGDFGGQFAGKIVGRLQ